MVKLSMQPEVLTIEEVASYLRVPPDVVLHEAAQGHLPGRKIADTWRFLKAAVDDWLRTQDSRSILLGQFGALAHDDHLDELLKTVYQDRGRSETEAEIFS